MNIEVLPDDWAGEIAVVAEGAFLDAATLERPSTGRGTMDAHGDVTNPATTLATSVACRAQRLTARPRPVGVAGEQVATGDVRVEFARTRNGLQVGDRVILTAAQDAWLLGRSLRITEVTGNTLHATRVVWCSSDQAIGG